jgi:hypothetical protein
MFDFLGITTRSSPLLSVSKGLSILSSSQLPPLTSLPSLSMSNAPSSRTASPLAETEDDIRARAEACQKIVDDAISGSISGPSFLERLKDAGATPNEAKDYIDQYTR